MNEPHTVVPYVVITHTYNPRQRQPGYALEFRTDYDDYRGSEPANINDDDSKRLAVGRIIESVMSVTGATRLDIEFIV